MLRTRSHLPGTPPATLTPLSPDESYPPHIRLVEYGQHGCTETTVEHVADLPVDDPPEGVWRWIEFNGLGNFEEFRLLGERFHLHPLALEDILNTGQRPKVEVYERFLFIVAQMMYHEDESFCTEQVAMFLGKRLLITVQEDPHNDVFDPVRERVRTGRGNSRRLGTDYLAYALLDAIIDHCFPILECIGEALEELEDEMLDNPGKSCIGRLHDFRRTLVTLRRAIWPQRDVITYLLHDESGLVSAETKVYLRDAYDHTIRIMDLIESYRDIAGGLLELYLSSVSQRTNEIMRVLTVISAIFIPLTFIAGVYGMNFKYMPELDRPYGYFVLLGIMLAIALGQIAFFKKKGWL